MGEAAASGLKQICVVIREGKEVIREYFDLKTSTGKSQEAMAELEAVVADCELTLVCQEHQLGLGDALLQARDFVGTESFVMMIPKLLPLFTEALQPMSSKLSQESESAAVSQARRER